MKQNIITIKSEGYVHCKSCFYSSCDILSQNLEYSFSQGINRLIGDIDSGNWAVSYLLSMYQHKPEDFCLFGDPVVVVDGRSVSINEFSKYSCYMDRYDPLFSSNVTIKEIIGQGLRDNKNTLTENMVKELFCIDNERFERPLSGMGNEIFKAMAAIGYSHEKKLFCFPWMSSKRFESYNKNLVAVLQTLEDLNRTVIVPVGLDTTK